MDEIQRKRKRKKTMKLKRGITDSTMKKRRLLEVCAESMDNYGMLLEILSWLPVKSLLRFMCVSKQWNTLISSHPFRKLHREKHTSSPPLLIASYNTEDIEEPPYDPELQMETHLVTSDLEGKFFKRITIPIPPGPFEMKNVPYQSKLLSFVNSKSKKFYLYNPSTRQSFLLTNPSCFSSPKFQRLYSSVYGYIPSKDEYIMVHLVKWSNGNLVCEILENISISNDNFKLHYNEWESCMEATTRLHRVEGLGIFVGGAFYWQAISKKNHKEVILSFDVETKCFSTFGYPQNLSDDDFDDTALLELKGDLYLSSFPESPAVLVLWKLSSDNMGWTSYWKFDFKRLFGYKSGMLDLDLFQWQIFVYVLKYLKGYDDQPSDDQVSAKMGQLRLAEGLNGRPIWNVAAVHTNMLTL